MTLAEKLIESHAIKKLLIDRSIEFGIPLRYVCAAIGLNYDVFLKGYLNSHNPHDCNVSDEDLQKILLFLGIEVRLQVIIKSDYDRDKERKFLEEKWHEFKQKKGNTTGNKRGDKSTRRHVGRSRAT